MYTAIIETSLTTIQEMGEDFKTPQFFVDYPAYAAEDITGQDIHDTPTTPNRFIIKAIVDQSGLLAIEADSAYSIIWAEEIIEDII